MVVDNLYLSQDLTVIHNENLPYFGYLITANKPVYGVPSHIENGCYWMLDNGAFSKAGFIKEYWLEWMDYMKPYQDKCIAVVIPDVVADCVLTLKQFPEYNPLAKSRGYKTAFVTQNGMTKDMLSWSDFDCLFVGGSDDHKMGLEARLLINEGLEQGKHIHVDRVNTEYRLLHFWDCHTWDGSAVTIKPEKYESIIVNGVKAVIKKKEDTKNMPSLFDFI